MADFDQVYNNPLFHMGAGLLAQPGNVGRGLLGGMQSYQQYQGNQQQQQQQQMQNQMMLAKIAQQKRQQEAQRQQAEQQRAAQTRVLQGMAPEPTIPFQRGGEPGGVMDIAQAYPEVGTAMVKGRYAPKAGAVPSAIQEAQYYEGLSPERRELYDRARRGQPWLNIGGEFVQPGAPGAPGAPRAIPKTLAPQEEPALMGRQAAAKESGKQFEAARGKWRASETKLLTTIDASKARQDVLDSAIADAKALLDESTTSYGALIANWPATDAKRLSNLLDTIKANVGFSELQAMRSASPTGGALGQVSEMENRLLQSVLGSLDQAGDSGDLANVLDTILAQRLSGIARLEEAYNMDKVTYGSRIPERKAMTPKTSVGRFTVEAM